MDETDLLKTAGFSTTGVAIILIVYRVLKSLRGKRLVSQCCGKKLEVGVDVEPMTPKEAVVNPLALREMGRNIENGTKVLGESKSDG